MRGLLITATTLAAILAVPSVAAAQATTATGAIVGAGAGAIIAGPPGAVVGGVIGGSVGIAAEPRVVVTDRYYVEPEVQVVVPRRRVCWVDDWGRQLCRVR